MQAYDDFFFAEAIIICTIQKNVVLLHPIKNRKRMIVVFTGAGVSAESGLGTFRDSDGLWEHYRVEDVCTHEAWLRNPQLCVKFYNDRRRDTLAAQPNAAHLAIAKLQQALPDTRIITQNIDDLHERAGAKDVIHLHGEITKLRSSLNETATVPLEGWEQHYGERHPVRCCVRISSSSAREFRISKKPAA